VTCAIGREHEQAIAARDEHSIHSGPPAHGSNSEAAHLDAPLAFAGALDPDLRTDGIPYLRRQSTRESHSVGWRAERHLIEAIAPRHDDSAAERVQTRWRDGRRRLRGR
jgi:hypothetical protein